MKKRETISTLLGTSQMEMAMLLKINRSQWSMFESGKRDIPLAAKVVLGKILGHVKWAKATASKLPSQMEKQETKEMLQTLLEVNEYKQWQLEKKVTLMEKKQTEIAAASHLIDYLENHTDKTETHMKDMSKSIQYRTNKEKQPNALHTLVTYQIKQKVLQYEEELLKETLGKLS